MRSLLRCGRLAALGFLALSAIPSARAQLTTAPQQGIRVNDPRVHALSNARIITAPGQVIEKGTVLIRDGLIAEAGAAINVPPEARVWDLAGKTIYAGFIDSYSRIGLPETLQPEPLRQEKDPDDPEAKPKEIPREPVKGTRAWNPRVTPERDAAEYVKFDKKAARTLRELGFATALVVPGRGIFRGSSALVALREEDVNATVVAPGVAQHIALEFDRGEDAGYPNSLMGSIALIRQTLLDAGWYAAAQEAYRKAPSTTERPEANASLAALAAHLQRKQPSIFEAEDELDLLRALRIAEEFKLAPVALFGNGYEYRVQGPLAASKTPVIVPFDFPDVPEIESPAMAIDYNLDELQHWDRAPENPGRLAEAGIPIAFTTEKLEKPAKEFWARLRLAVRRGLKPDAALAALTTTPAQIFGVNDRLGSIARGRIANLVVADGDLFTGEARILTTWIDGEPYETDAAREPDPRGTWELATGGKTVPMTISGDFEKPEAKAGDQPAAFSLQGNAVVLVVPAGLWGKGDGGIRLSGRIEPDAMQGRGVAPDGEPMEWSARRIAPHDPKKKEPSPRDEGLPFPDTFPAGAYGRAGLPEQPAAVFVRGATIWTSGPQGILENADLLITNGKIAGVGPGLKVPAQAAVIDGSGMHVTPGIVDCHSHTAISKGVNESSHAVTAEVRIGDVVDATDISLYREVAGGVTTANLLHGSANPIGGQNQVIKFRWGALPEELKFAEAPPGVKFALGENVKQSNWGDRFRTRYPQTRMGVEQIIRDRFRAAQEYDARLKRKEALPARRDLQLEALAEILSGKRLIHCHSYRLDEVLAFLQLTKEFGVTPATLQHILEGYKIADEIAAAGVGASSFADWWAYKVEAFDAIPYNAGMMASRGVLTTVNSDSNDLARRLNTEAGKSTKYSDMPPPEALKLVTINAAKQLRIDRRVGSLEAGKDADFVIWNGYPLSNYTRVSQTWIDGRKYFDREEDLQARGRFAAMREQLVQKALAERVKELAKPKDAEKKDPTQDDADAAPKPPGHAWHRAHELGAIYGSGADRHNCSDE